MKTYTFTPDNTTCVQAFLDRKVITNAMHAVWNNTNYGKEYGEPSRTVGFTLQREVPFEGLAIISFQIHKEAGQLIYVAVARPCEES